MPRNNQPSKLINSTDISAALRKGGLPPIQSGLNVNAAEGSFSMSSDMGTIRTPMMYMDPMMDPILQLYPQDNQRESNRRFRHYYKFQPFIRNIIDFHTETPLSDFYLRCEGSEEAETYFNNFKDEKELLNMIVDLHRDYWLLGEAFMYANWDEYNQEFSHFVQYPPEEVEVYGVYTDPKRAYALRPNKEIAKLFKSNDPAARLVAQHIMTTNPKQAEHIMRNKSFTIDGDRLIVLQRTMARYVNRGVSPMLAVLKDLLYEDNLTYFRNAFIQRHSYPLKIFKLGSEPKGFIPSMKMFNEFRQQLVQATNDPDFNLVTHPFVNVEYHTGHDKILNLIPYYDLVQKRIFAGLFVSEAIITGEKTPYSAGITWMRGLMNRYLTIRNQIQTEITRKVFKPLSRIRKYYAPTQAELSHRVKTRRDDSRLIVPTFYWQKANLLSNQAIMQMVIGLRDKHEVPFRYVAEMFGWDIDDIVHQLKREEGSRVDPEWRNLRTETIKKDKGLSNSMLLGDDIDEAIKVKYKKGEKGVAAEPEPKSPTSKKAPAGVGRKPGAGAAPERGEAQLSVRPPAGGEGEVTPPEAPEVSGDRKPRPGETNEGGGGE